MRAYYNEIDPYAAQWIRNLIKAGHVTDGEVDERSIVDVVPSDLRGFDRCHFFAGVAVWDYALGLAGWGDAPVWTGSCPCQPFSAAGKGGGFDDERHLWPAWHHLIRECRPATVLGEQVASKDGLGWLDLVHADLEGEGYAVGAADLCAAGVGAPHIRQRLWFVADASGAGRERRQGLSAGRVDDRSHAGRLQGADGPFSLHEAGALVMDHASGARGGRHTGTVPSAQGEGAGQRGRVGHQPHELVAAGAASGLADADGGHASAERQQPGREHGQQPSDGLARTFWSDAEWIACRDEKARPVEPGTFPLAHGAPARVGRLRAYGNAINAEAAACFIGAVMDGL